MEHSVYVPDADRTAAGQDGAPSHAVDLEFTSYPLRELAAAALQRADELGAEHADFRVERVRGQQIRLSDGALETLVDADDLGLAVRVVLDGTWGFAAAVDLTTQAAVRAAEEAIDVARVAAAINTDRIELAGEPGYGDVSWVSAYEIDPLSVAVADKLALLTEWSAQLLASDVVDHVDASLMQVRECKFFTDGATTSTQQRVRLLPGAHRGRGAAGRRVRDHAHARPARGPRLGVPDRHRLGLPRRAGRAARSCWPGSWPPRRSRPAGTTW